MESYGKLWKAMESMENIENAEHEEKRLYEIKMADLKLRLLSSHDEKMVNELVSLVNGRVNKIMDQRKGTSFQSALFLVSLNLTEELFFLKKRALNLLKRVEDKTHNILSHLESSSAIEASGLEN